MTKDEANGVVEMIANMNDSDALLFGAEAKRVVMGRAIAHASAQARDSETNGWLVAIRTIDGAWWHIYDVDGSEVVQ